MKLQDVLIIDMDHVVSSEKNARLPKDFDAITMEGIVVSSQLELEEGLKAQIWYGQFRSPVRITFNSLSPAQPPVCTLAYTTMPEAFFFQKLVSSPGSRATDYHDKISRIKQAEDILVDSLRNNLPPVKEIAQAVFMSESTLKRYFKVFYGKNIYEFYLQKKMELAKRMMIEENLNVSQVAREIGYENPNNFIATFKKHFGYLPGEIRRGA